MFSFVVGWIHSCGTQRYRRPTATPWINLKNITLSEGSQTQEHIRHDSVHMKSPDKAKFIGTESKLVVPVDSVVIICLHCRRQGRHGFDPWGGKISWRRKWQPTPVFLPGKSHGQRSLASYRPGSCKRVGQDWATEHLKTEVGMRSDHMCSWRNFGDHGDVLKLEYGESALVCMCSRVRLFVTPGSCVHGVSQARMLEWVIISFFTGSFWARDRTHVSYLGRRILYHWATWEARWRLTALYIYQKSLNCFYMNQVDFKVCKSHLKKVNAEHQLPRDTVKQKEWNQLKTQHWPLPAAILLSAHSS